MLTTPVKCFMLPFATKKNQDPKIEEAAVFAISELQRNKGGGLLLKQPQEKLSFVSRAAYPVWVYPKNNSALIFDGLNDSRYTASYSEAPSAGVFLDNLQLNQRPRENYAAFLSKNQYYFQKPLKEKEFTLQGIITDTVFKAEFNLYRKEADDLSVPATVLEPLLEANEIAAILSELDKLQTYINNDAQKLTECLRALTKTTSQYISEIDFEANATNEEAEAKIKAQGEFTNPQITKLNKEYQREIKKVTQDFESKIKNQQKQKIKILKDILNAEAKSHKYEREAKAQSKKGNEFYEKHWKEKVKVTEKDLATLKKENKNIENNIKTLSKQKTQDISKLSFDLDSKIKLARQPLKDLAENREDKNFAYKQEKNKLLALEKTIVYGINKSIKLRETINTNFEGLGTQNTQIKNPTLFYIPFYLVCYENDSARRYTYVSPSSVSSIDFSTKIKGALGIPKIKDLLTPRFQAIADLITNVETLSRQDNCFEETIWNFGVKNNLIKNNAFQSNVAEGLHILRTQGWLSENETSDLSSLLHS